MEINQAQKETILENLQKLLALGFVIVHICDEGIPPNEALGGWQFLLWDIEAEIRRIIEPEALEKTA
jgi:hypothetical protein